MKSLFFLLILVAAVAIGGKFYVENEYKKELDKTLNSIRPVADINYRDLKIWFDGSITLTGFSYLNPEGIGSVNINEIKVVTDDKLMPLRGKSLFKSNNQLPKWLKLEIDRVAIDSILAEPPVEDECTSFWTSFIYSEIGIDKIFSNTSVSFDFNDINNARAEVSFDDQVSRSYMTINFSVNEARSASATQTIPIDSIDMSMSLDAQYASQFNDYCANKLEITTDQYLNEVVASPRYSFDTFGYNLGEQTSKALALFMTGDKNLSISSRPADQLKKPQSFNALSRENIIRGLRLKVKLDNQNVLVRTDTENDFISRKALKAEEEGADEKETEIQKPRRRQFVDVSTSRISSAIDQRVKIWREGEKTRIDGVIKSISNNIAFIEIRKFGGIATYEIPVNEIRKIQAYR